MIPTVAVPNAQTPAPIQPTAFSGVPTQTSMSRIPFYAVPSNPNPPEAYNNTRPVGDSLSGGASAGSTLSGAPAAGGRVQAGTTGNLNFPSTTLFMTQMMGQGSTSNSDTSLIRSFFSSFTPSSPTPDAEMIDRFAQSKFLPSNAFKPLPKPAGTAQLAPQPQTAAPSAAPSQQSVAQANQLLEQQQVSNVRQLNVAPQAPATNNNVATTQLPTRNTNNLDRPNPSLVRPQGVNAYLSTLSRNVSNLESATDNPIRVSL